MATSNQAALKAKLIDELKEMGGIVDGDTEESENRLE